MARRSAVASCSVRSWQSCIILLLIIFSFITVGTASLEPNEFLGPEVQPRGATRSSGQVVRLRGKMGKHEMIGEGRVEVFYQRRWGLVCDDSFDLNDANVICRQLGFSRGAIKSVGESGYGYGSLRHFALDDLMCDGVETNIFHCRRRALISDCSRRSETAGVICKQNYPSKCDAGGVLFNGKCYYFHSDDEKNFQEAKAACRRDGGSLVVIQSQEENDFISEVLFSLKGFKKMWYTAGKRIGRRWKWQVANVDSSSFTKWRPGIRRNSESRRCMVLHHNSEDLMERDYYYWDAVSCSGARPYVCQKIPNNIGCINGNGVDYEGSANVSRLGLACLRWNEESIVRRGLVFRQQVGWEHNFCRNPDRDSSPWCMITPEQYDLCDIPDCTEQDRPPVCEPDEIRCGDLKECVAREFICDYDQDCPNNFDERNCTDWLGVFDRTAGMKLAGEVTEVWTYIPHAQGCAKRCMESKNFKCLSFSYVPEKQNCFLSSTDRKQGVALVKVGGADYYELLKTSTDSPGNG